MDSYVLITLLCGVIVISYVFNIISRKTRIPSVLLLLGTGIAIKSFYGAFLSEAIISKAVEMFGIVGLIMIILEASLDLRINPTRFKLIARAFLSATVILFVSSFGIAFLINFWLNEQFLNCLVYAVPLSIVSSAIVIPSVETLTEEKKEFIIYEASFSDVLGILFFNYLINETNFSLGSGVMYGGKIIISTLVSIGVALCLVYLLSKITFQVKFFLIFAVLVALYALGKIFDLPALLIILNFGLLVNNRAYLRPKFIFDHINENSFNELEKQIKSITAETSFLVRTFFFIIFGFSIDLIKLQSSDVWYIGTAIVVLLLIVRFVFLKYINPKENPMPELLMMPRGLITILLFYKIPPTLYLFHFNRGILFFVILFTSILMMIGLLITHKNVTEIVENVDTHF